jgi:hypothetical protein
MSVDKNDLYRLIDELPERELSAAKRYLEFLIESAIKNNPWRELLANPPETDEELLEEDKTAIKEAEKDLLSLDKKHS